MPISGTTTKTVSTAVGTTTARTATGLRVSR